MTVTLVLFGLWAAVSVMLIGSVAPVRGRRSLDWLLGKGPVSLGGGHRSTGWPSPDPGVVSSGVVRLERPLRGRSGFAAYEGRALGGDLDLPRSDGWDGPLDGTSMAPLVGARTLSRIPVTKKRTKLAHKKRPTSGETDTRDRLAVVG